MPKVQPAPDAVADIQAALSRALKLLTPRFVLESAGTKVSGSIISATFRGLADSERQRRIWDAVDRKYGSASVQRVGTLLAFTPDEWDLNDDSETHK